MIKDVTVHFTKEHLYGGREGAIQELKRLREEGDYLIKISAFEQNAQIFIGLALDPHNSVHTELLNETHAKSNCPTPWDYSAWWGAMYVHAINRQFRLIGHAISMSTTIPEENHAAIVDALNQLCDAAL